MQLQNQSFKPKFKLESQQSKNALPSSKDLFPSFKIVIPTSQILEQLRNIQLTAKADFYYLTSLRKKAFRILYLEDYQVQCNIMEKTFLSFKYFLFQQRKQKLQKKTFFQDLTLSHQRNKLKKRQKKQINVFYQSKILRKVFTKIFLMIRLQKKSKSLESYLLNERKLQLINYLKQQRRQNKRKKLQNEQTEIEIQKLLSKKILTKFFRCWQFSNKLVLVEKIIKDRILKELIKNLIKDKQEIKSIIQNFEKIQSMKKKQKIFESLKQLRLQSECSQWHIYRLQKFYFNQWLSYHITVINEKEIQKSNQIILFHFLQNKDKSKNLKIKSMFFNFWKSIVQLQKEERKEKQIFNAYAELKQKESLQKKYFQLLNQNRKYQKACKFYLIKLQIKTIKSFQQNYLKSIQIQKNIFFFIQYQTLKKYLLRIQLYNTLEHEKIYLFSLRKYWFKFTYNITAQYFQKIQMASNYQQISLKFKVLLAFKKNVEINRKNNHFVFILNIAMPLKRWNQGFRMRKLLFRKEFYHTKRIFIQWKIISIRKLLSRSKEANETLLYEQSPPDSNKYLLNHRKSCNGGSFQVEEQVSILNRINEFQSGENDLLTKIKNERNKLKNSLSDQTGHISGFNHQRLLFSNQDLPKNTTQQKTKLLGLQGKKLRSPTWSSDIDEQKF